MKETTQVSLHWIYIILPVVHLHTLEEERNFRQQENGKPDAVQSNSRHDMAEHVSLHFDLVMGSKHVTNLPLYLNSTQQICQSHDRLYNTGSAAHESSSGTRQLSRADNGVGEYLQTGRSLCHY